MSGLPFYLDEIRPRRTLPAGALRFGAVLWLRGDAGVTGDPITQWADQSGQANHATATGDYRPAVLAAGLNGLDGVRFDGVGNQLATPDVAWSTAKRFTIFVVSQRTGPGSTAGSVVGSFGLGGTGNLTQTDAVYTFYDGLFDRTLEAHGEVAPELKVVRRTADSNLNFRRGGSNVGDVACSNWTEANTEPIYVGMYGNDTFPWGGDLFEIIVFPTSLSNAAVAIVEDEIAERWGL